MNLSENLQLLHKCPDLLELVKPAVLACLQEREDSAHQAGKPLHFARYHSIYTAIYIRCEHIQRGYAYSLIAKYGIKTSKDMMDEIILSSFVTNNQRRFSNTPLDVQEQVQLIINNAVRQHKITSLLS